MKSRSEAYEFGDDGRGTVVLRGWGFSREGALTRTKNFLIAEWGEIHPQNLLCSDPEKVQIAEVWFRMNPDYNREYAWIASYQKEEPVNRRGWFQATLVDWRGDGSLRKILNSQLSRTIV